MPISKIITFAIMPFTAITQALSPIVGYNFGAGKPERIRKTIRFCTAASFIYALVLLLIMEATPGSLIRLFTDNRELIARGGEGLRILAAALVFVPLPMLSGAACQAIGQKLWAFLLYAANLVFFIPTAFLFAPLLGVTGVWWAYVAANAASAVLALVKIRRDKVL